MLSIIGEAGTGKSTLGHWIRERLERSIGLVRQDRSKFEVFSYSFGKRFAR